MIHINPKKCLGCSYCFEICPNEAIKIINGIATIKLGCIDCYKCLGYCPVTAITR